MLICFECTKPHGEKNLTSKMWLTSYWSQHETTPSCVGLVMWRAWRSGDVTARYWTTQAGSCPLNITALGENEDGEFDPVDDEDTMNLAFKYTVINGALILVQSQSVDNFEFGSWRSRAFKGVLKCRCRKHQMTERSCRNASGSHRTDPRLLLEEWSDNSRAVVLRGVIRYLREEQSE